MNTYSNNNKNKEEILRIRDTYMLEDVWRVCNPADRQYTWRRNVRGEEKASRLDYALTSIGLNVENTTFCPIIRSDHRAVVVVIKCNSGKKRGCGYWKLNVSLLHDKNYIDFMNENLDRKISSLKQYVDKPY